MSWSRRYLPALLLSLAILLMAGSAGSREVTGRLANPFLESLGFSPETAELLHGIVRKVGHFLAYALLATLALRAVRGPRPVDARSLLLAGAWAVLLAATDEAVQRLSPDRTSAAIDVAIDVTGALAGLAVAAFLVARRGDGIGAVRPMAGGGGPG
jgi:VanZ family protein